ncbi:MAG: MFS transporter, partial [Acidobacteriota bacterium]|nr:MFS transporter [Acidobacteriota bacterium]
GLIGLGISLLPLLIGWQFAHSFRDFIMMGVLLGVAGASFAAALPLASGWYPPEYQGLALGIAGAGNSGTLFASLFAPRLARAFGWHSVFAFTMLPVVAVWILFALLAKDAPRPVQRKRWSDYVSVLKVADTGWFCFIYSLTFGGFSGLVSYLSIFFHDQYHLTGVQAGDLTTIVVVFGSFLRPVGGSLSDRMGGYRMLLFLLGGVAISLAAVGTLPSLGIALAFLILAMGMLGMGNGAVFQLVPQRFPDKVGLLTGIVGAAGGFGGFMLPNILGTLKDATGSFGAGFMVVAATMFSGVAALIYLGPVWRKQWSLKSALRAGLVRENYAVEEAEPAA